MIPQPQQHDMSISGLRSAYAAALTPADLCQSIRQLAEEYEDYNIWINLFDQAQQQPFLDALAEKDPENHPLWGIPFAFKDNIDLQGFETTAGCEAFAYTADADATVIKQLLAAGAIPVGKTNLDQFATGLNGTRSPWGPCRNSFDPDFISGGSSAGSAVAVALGLASFSLGTDTAGSGRVPACFNNLIGLKPSRGLLSAAGVVPACRSLDCVSIFAFNADDANTVMAVAEGFDESDGYSRHNPYRNRQSGYGLVEKAVTVGVIAADQLAFFGDTEYQAAYQKTLEILASNGFFITEIDYSTFDETARLLYEGPWVAERYIATTPLIETEPEAIFPVVRDIIAAGGKPRAVDLFNAEYRLHELRQRCMPVLESVDCLLTPTAPRLFSVDEMLADPIVHNSELGYYTNFVNLLDLAAVAVPTLMTESGLPFGVTLVGPCFSDRFLLSLANKIQRTLPLPMGATATQLPELRSTIVTDSSRIDIVVCGAHLQGLALNWQLTERGAWLVEVTRTSDDYQLHALAGEGVARPALVKTSDGTKIEVEVWSMPADQFGGFVADIPAPLGIGSVQLADGRLLNGFICEMNGLQDAENVSSFGGWRAYLQSL